MSRKELIKELESQISDYTVMVELTENKIIRYKKKIRNLKRKLYELDR